MIEAFIEYTFVKFLYVYNVNKHDIFPKLFSTRPPKNSWIHVCSGITGGIAPNAKKNPERNHSKLLDDELRKIQKPHCMIDYNLT